MREVTASEASRQFSAILDGAESGETIVVTRGGRRIALIVPAPRANGRAVGEVLARWRDRVGVDDAFADAVEAAGQAEGEAGGDNDPWHG